METKLLGVIGDADGEECRKLYVYKNVHGNHGDIDIFDHKNHCYGDLMGYFSVKYLEPTIFPMTIEEVYREEYSQAWDILEKSNHIERNDFGTPFWKN